MSKKTKILVIGDVMVDEYVDGKVERVSPEAPVPVLQVTNKSFKAGGAANVALNCCSLGADARVIGAIGDDKDGKKLKNSLKEAGVHCNLRVTNDFVTTKKQRIVSSGQQIVRLDYEIRKDLKIFYHLKNEIIKSIEWSDVVILSDYGKESQPRAEK